MTTTPTTPDTRVIVAIEVSRKRISDLLCSALEGGSNYWYIIKKHVPPPTLTFRSDADKVYTHLDFPLNEGGALLIGDMEDAKSGTKRLDLEAIGRGLAVMARAYPSHFGDFISENDDATTGDVFLQCCLFGEVIYG